MSIHAVSWALKQELPTVPKFVLMALCERANIKTGQCWPGIDEIAEATSMSNRSVVTYITALVRNGYVVKQEMRGKNGRMRNNHYWICFDREPAAWIGPKAHAEVPTSENEENEAAENPESAPYANIAHGDHTQPDSHGPDATACARQESLAEPEIMEPPTAPTRCLDRPVEPPPGYRQTHRVEEQAKLQAAEEARKPKRIPVIEGSEPWKAWLRHGHPPTLVGIVEVNGKRHRGWSFDAEKCQGLYPRKQSTGPPPISKLMTSEEEEIIAKQWS